MYIQLHVCMDLVVQIAVHNASYIYDYPAKITSSDQLC